MAKKNLNEKIKITVAGFGVLTCLYFLIAVWLKSDGVHFNPTLTYELLKDTLTLGAAFLAPVAAFVLFSDWRVQHKKIQEEEIVLEILRDIKLNTPRMDVCLGSIYVEHRDNPEFITVFGEQIESHRMNVLKRIGYIEFSKTRFECQLFHDKAMLLREEQYDLLTAADILHGDVEAMRRLQAVDPESEELNMVINMNKYHFEEFSKNYKEYSETIDIKVLEIERLSKRYMV